MFRWGAGASIRDEVDMANDDKMPVCLDAHRSLAPAREPLA
jgi:hypothetical protein